MELSSVADLVYNIKLESPFLTIRHSLISRKGPMIKTQYYRVMPTTEHASNLVPINSGAFKEFWAELLSLGHDSYIMTQAGLNLV